MALKLTGAPHCIPDYTSVSMLYVHLACGCQTKVTAKSSSQKLQIFLPIYFKLATKTPQQNQCVIR